MISIGEKLPIEFQRALLRGWGARPCQLEADSRDAQAQPLVTIGRRFRHRRGSPETGVAIHPRPASRSTGRGALIPCHATRLLATSQKCATGWSGSPDSAAAFAGILSPQ